MFNLNFYKKKLRKILLPIIKIIESFFTEIDRSKSQSNRLIPFKKKIIHLDSRIESFFDKFKNLKKFNQSKKKLHYLNSKLSASIALIVLLFFSYFFIPVFYNKNEIKKLLIDQIFSTVRWRDTLIFMSDKGVKNFIEIGPGKALSGMVKRTIKNVNSFSINSITDIKNLKNEFKK